MSREHHLLMKRKWQADRRARQLNQTPPTADNQIIKEIYLNCPKDFEVDHIIPLSRGGLHHQDNLQYLTPLENKRKGNRIISAGG
jgi:5-methylcytosine-specific restriction endonuclease McrA|tara:strand:- start:38 stop:292 length:255 start_codon:yes stop_codon:yes gene_type:complete